MLKLSTIVTSDRRLICLTFLLCLQAPAPLLTHAVAHELRTLDQLSGEYRDGQQRVRLHADGRFTWEATYLPVGTDAGMVVTASGKAKLEMNSLSLAIDERSLVAGHGGPAPAGAKALLPARLYPLKASGLTFLLDEKAINDVANRINAYGRAPVDASPYLHRVQPGIDEAGSLRVEPHVLIPKDFAHRMLAAPLQGKILKIEAVVEQRVNVAGWMQPPVWRTQYSARLLIDRGSSHGAFRGMQLFVGSARRTALVQDALAQQCQAKMVWIDAAPQVGDPVSSAFR